MSKHTKRSRTVLFRRDGVTRNRACGRKVKNSRERAHSVAKERSEATGHRLIAYECPFCPSWHIGHQSRRVKRR